MIIDSESRRAFKHALDRLASTYVSGLAQGNFYDNNGTFSVAKFEQHRGIIIGLGLAIDLLDEKPSVPQPRAEENSNEQSGQDTADGSKDLYES